MLFQNSKCSPKAHPFWLLFPDCTGLADRRCCLSLCASCPLCPCVTGAPAMVAGTACSNGTSSAPPVFPEYCWKKLRGNIILCTALEGGPIALGTDFHVESGPISSFVLTLKCQEDMWHWASYMDVGCLCVLVCPAVLPATSMGRGGEKALTMACSVPKLPRHAWRLLGACKHPVQMGWGFLGVGHDCMSVCV